MLDMFLASVFYSKVLNNQYELYLSCSMFPKTGYQFALLIAVFILSFLEELVGQ